MSFGLMSTDTILLCNAAMWATIYLGASGTKGLSGLFQSVLNEFMNGMYTHFSPYCVKGSKSNEAHQNCHHLGEK
ncbi:hypothetical protein VSU01S_28850 [Vibrio superstes NBRC 103154]|uniref:Uncharacterized protein n=1 Tax=Vibrio superstes NBRC 103154 TaxID=1219062 RepID=A0A511QTH5_9VIBR|nr:hypothetical protein VSU01S_28850 [Vibrio superstes NBRC 103154]